MLPSRAAHCTLLHRSTHAATRTKPSNVRHSHGCKHRHPNHPAPNVQKKGTRVLFVYPLCQIPGEDPICVYGPALYCSLWPWTPSYVCPACSRSRAPWTISTRTVSKTPAEPLVQWLAAAPRHATPRARQSNAASPPLCTDAARDQPACTKEAGDLPGLRAETPTYVTHLQSTTHQARSCMPARCGTNPFLRRPI